MKKVLPVSILLLCIVLAARYFEVSGPPPDPGTPGTNATVQRGNTPEAVIAEAWANRRSDVQIEAIGTVARLLPDDNDGGRHQRFIVELSSGHTLLIAHNIDLAPRIDTLRRGDTVRFFGEYEWNERGGVIHWTHHDPAGRHIGGWLEHAGRRYE